ncbi:MAG: GAF domain-containing protein [Chloroflexota bacterium]
MSQRTNQGLERAQTIRVGENPYLERVMRIFGIVTTISIVIFGLAGIFSIAGSARDELNSQHTTTLDQVESDITAKLDQYRFDLLSLSNDQNLRDHLTTTTNFELASARASELLLENRDEYLEINFITVDENRNTNLAFNRANNNFGVAPVFVYSADTAYTAHPQSEQAFRSALLSNSGDITLGDFYVDVGNDDQAQQILLDTYIPVYTTRSTPIMIVNLKLDTQELREIVNFVAVSPIDGQEDTSSRRVVWFDNLDTVIADSSIFGTASYTDDLTTSDGNNYYETILAQGGRVLDGTNRPIPNVPVDLLFSTRVIDYPDLSSLNWRIVVTDNVSTYHGGTLFIIFVVILSSVVTAIIIIAIVKQALRPLFNSFYEADTVLQTAVNNSSVPIRSTGNQAEFLTATRRVATRINRLSEDLQDQTNRRNRDLQVAGRISQQTATLSDLDTLANRAINLICNELEFYHAQIFLLDKSGTYLELAYSRGDAGQALLAQGHRILVGSESVVGQAGAKHRTVIVNDTNQDDELHAVNPILSETRAEMALPLLVGEELLGVLDIQSNRDNVFFEDDIPTYELLANQLAVAIYNTRLRQEATRRVEQIETLNRQLTREAWGSLEEKLNLDPVYGTDLDNSQLSAEISIRGQVLGHLEANLPDGQQFTDGDQQILKAVADRVSLAIENARLFQETQTSLSETQILYQLSRQLNEAEDLQDVLQAIIDTVATDASSGQVWLFDEIVPSVTPDWVRISVDLAMIPREANVRLLNRRLQLSQYPFMERLSATEITTISDIRNSTLRLDLLQLFANVNAVSLIFVPVNLRGIWKGFMTIAFNEPRQFAERDLRIYNALIAQAGVAIDNRLLLQQTEDALARQEKLYAASRLINTSQGVTDLVYAAVATSSDPQLDFWLSMLEGQTDDEGWTTQVRIVAKSSQGNIEEASHLLDLRVPPHSPMRRREPEILVDPGEDIEDVPPAVKWMRELNYKFMAIFPLFSDNTPIALFYIVNAEIYDLSQDDYEVYRALTGQMSTQIQKRRLLTQTEETLNEISRLYVATRAISGAPTSEAIFDAVAGHLAMPIIRQNMDDDQDLNLSITVLLAYPEPNLHAPQLRYEYFWTSDPTRPNSVAVGTIISQEDAPFGMLFETNDDSVLVFKDMDNTPEDFPMIREILSVNGATAAAAAPLWSRMRWFGALIIRTTQPDILDSNYIRFMQSIADQVALQVENQKLLEETQFERRRLSEILETLPVGVMVLDPDTMIPISINERVVQLLGRDVSMNEPFTAVAYDMYRTGTDLRYKTNDLPMYRALKDKRQVIPSEDIVIIRELYQRDLSISAAPIFTDNGDIRVIIAAFNDISTLRGMENTMQENLRETVMLYETQRALTESETLEDLYQSLTMQLALLQPSNGHLLIAEDNHDVSLVGSLMTPLNNVNAIRPMLQNTLVNVDDVQRYGGLDEDLRYELSGADARSVLVIPLTTRTRQRPLGWLMLTHSEPEAFTMEQERTMTSIGDMASQAIDNQLLVASTQVALAETEALYSANTVISRATDLYSLFSAIESLLNRLQPDMKAAFINDDGRIQEMFKVGFDNSELDLEHLMQLPLSNKDGLYVADITRNTLSQFELEIARAGHIAAFAAINLRVKDTIGGRLLIGYEHPHTFSKSDERYLSAIADSASIQLDNQVLLGQVQNTLQETTVLYQASKALIDVTEPKEIIDVIVTYVIPPHVTQVFIAMLNMPDWDAPSAAIDIVAGWQEDNELDLVDVNLTHNQFPAWTQLSSERVLTINDVHDMDNGLDDIERMSIESLDARSLVVMPLRASGRAIGAIWLGSQEAYDYTDRDLRIFQAFAEQTSLSLEAKRLLEQTEERARQLQTSAVISQNVGQILDLDVLLPQVVDLIKAQFTYDHVQIFLMDDENEWAMLRASTGEAGEKLLDAKHRLQRGSQSVIGKVTELGEPSIALDTADANVVHQPNPFLPMTRSEMALPMIVKGEIVGALDVQSNSSNAFTDEDIQVLTLLSSQIAVAIDNARLYEETQRSASDMSFLFELASNAASAESLDEALEYVSNEVRYNTRADLVAIYLPQMYEDYYGNRKHMLEINTLAYEDDLPLNEVDSIEMGDNTRLIGIVSEHAQPQIVQNIAHEDRYHPISQSCQSAIVLPIMSGNSLVGIIALENRRLNAYTPDTLTLLQTLTGSIGAIIQNTLLVEQLQASVEQLREVDRLKSQFLASMSHELRTPLNSIIGFSKVMLKGIDGPLTEMQEQDLTTIYNSGNHLLRLINDILDQAKIEADEMNLKFTYFEMKPLVESVKSIAIGLLKDKPELKLIVDVADGLPEVYGDEIRSRQILLNIVTNAIKFTQDGSVTMSVYAIEGDPAPMIRVDVTDTGIGIAEKDLPTVFQQFRQVDNSLTRTVGGTGLGLPLSKSLAEMQGGELTVASEVGVGSTFSVTIPTYEGAGEALERQREAKRTQAKPIVSKLPSSTESGLISRKDVEEARRRAAEEAQANGHGSNGTAV